jgi:hypothetical protein
VPAHSCSALRSACAPAASRCERSLIAPWLGAAVPLRVEVELVGALRGLISAEAGYVLSPVAGNDDAGRAIASHRGVWGTLGAGAALGF